MSTTTHNLMLRDAVSGVLKCSKIRFYLTMHYSAKHGLVRLSIRLSVTLVDHDHIG